MQTVAEAVMQILLQEIKTKTASLAESGLNVRLTLDCLGVNG